MNDAGRICMIPRGNYNASSDYEFLDVVNFNGAAYVARKNVSGISPTTGASDQNWMILCSAPDTQNLVYKTDLATALIAGIVKPDDTTIEVDANGVISIKSSYIQDILDNISGLSEDLSALSDEVAGKGDDLAYDAETGALQLKSGDEVLATVTVQGGGGTAIRLADVTGASAEVSVRTATIKWTDPEDIVLSGVTLAQWAGTKVVRKAGSAPSDVTDGTVVVDSTTRNQYSSTGLQDTGLEFNTTYYYRFFPYTTDNLKTSGSSVNVTPARVSISAVPSQNGTIEYDGTLRTASFNDYNSNQLDVTGNTGTNADTYTAVFTPKEGYQWSDGSLTGKEVSWTIDKQVVPVPTLNANVTLTYSGSEQDAAALNVFTGYDSSIMNVSGNTRTNAGSQKATFTLKDTDNYVWGSGTPEVTWTINKATFTAQVSIAGYTYAGTKSTPSVTNNPGNGAVTYYGRASTGGTATAWGSVTNTTYDAGTRYCYAVIAETDNYEGYTTPDKSFTIAKADFTAEVSIAGYTYAGTKSTPTVTNNPGNGAVTYYGRASTSGTATAWGSVTNTTYNAGTRYCYAVIAETTNYNSYTTPNKAFTIAKASFTATVSISGYTYAGTKSTPSVSNNPGNGTVTYYGRSTSSGAGTEWSQVTNKTFNAGTRYCYAVIAETTNYNSYTTGNTSFTIEQATGSVTASVSSVTLDADHTSVDVTMTIVGDGTVTASSNDTSIATASYNSSTKKVTISSVNDTAGSTSVMVTLAASTNYTYAYTSISVEASFSTAVGWADGTDDEILDMVTQADAGTLDLTEVWAVGDERSVSLSAMAATGVGESHVAQTVTMVLVAKDTKVAASTNPCYNYPYVTAKSGRSYPSFIVQQKNGLANGTTGEYGYMNSSNTNSGSWDGCARRTWCNSVYYNALPAKFKSLLKQVKVKTAQTYNGSTIQESSDYCFLLAAKEIFGGTASSAGSGTSYSNLTEFNALAQFDYYKTSANRVKYCGSGGSAHYWWERSPYYNRSGAFCRVNSSGSASYYGASGSTLVAPAGCI